MVSKCANPACATPFRYLHEGRIFVLRSASEMSTDVSNAVVERYLLCGNCAMTVTLVLRDGGVTLESLARMTTERRAKVAEHQRPAA